MHFKCFGYIRNPKCIYQITFLIWYLLIVFSAPGVNPAYIWPLNTIRNGQVPTNPPLKTYGNILVSGNSLVLEDESAYLNAGDFQGKILST